MTDQTFLDSAAASRYLKSLGIPAEQSTLEAWRGRGGGPAYYKFGRLVRYSVEDLHKWIERHARDNTAAA